VLIQQRSETVFLAPDFPPPYRPFTDSQNLGRCHRVIFFAIARNITSCTFIVRSSSPAGICAAVLRLRS
jgi:hypothetical protein